jgi:hypothetical protein
MNLQQQQPFNKHISRQQQQQGQQQPFNKHVQ